ncbi:HlyD family secretion protein [Oceanicella sp. SM1341]|uniref:HlyD family secretion protein n=1 Tax=Oceanicella sp. SM1341 TaxID=1548889 RepID=UPI000E506B8C|nr:HlyD family efflux transporter periplasmic adaptor subunit [Oceanicella sp. SM1341]
MPSNRWVAIVVVLAVALGAGAYWYFGREPGLPPGFASANGRIEAERVTVATKFAGRLAEVLVHEGDTVEQGEVIARLDASQIEAQLREAKAGVTQAEQSLAEARAVLRQREAELSFAEQELSRAASLGDRGVASRQTRELRQSERDTAAAAVLSARAGIARTEAGIEAARATVDRLQADLSEYVLRAPRAGRVQYRLAEPGEILAAGGGIVTILDLAQVYMTVYLPTSAAGMLRYGAEARIVFDAAPQYVVPANVTFVASEAQFTPKYVETESEREKLMFRVKVTIPPELLAAHSRIVKAGVPGVSYVRLDPGAEWPQDLAVALPDAE